MSRTNRLFINNVEDCVEEMLESIALQHPGLRLLQDHRVIVRENISSKNVSVISGGGSGHEPFAAGFVGHGMLTAAVAGSVFASPPPHDILASIKATKSLAGTLLVVANYTGDRLNFGIALERAKSLGHKIRMVVVGEDCAVESSDKTAGRRGLVGIVNVIKVAGALSEQGKSLDEVVNLAQMAAANMSTIGVSLTGCSIPGSGSSFTLDQSEMELGLGAHGEAGVKRLKLQTADQTVTIMINHMMNTNNANHINLPAGSRVAVTVNNLGGLSALEMHILARKVIKDLEKRQLLVDRFFLGHFMTSLDMSGFNVNVTKLTDEITSCLDAPTDAPAWPRISVSALSKYSCHNEHLAPSPSPISEETVEFKMKASAKVTEEFLNCIKQVCEKLISQEAYLNELDTSCGDGDCGSTLKRGASMVLSKINNWSNMSVANVLLQLASCAEISMGGASGGLYSLFFTALSHHAQNFSLTSFKQSIDKGMQSVMEYGKAEPGDRTMVDSLYALSLSLGDSIEQKQTFSQALDDAAGKVAAAAEKTSSMKARAGRASYVANNLLSRPDPGAVAVAIIVKAISTCINAC